MRRLGAIILALTLSSCIRLSPSTLAEARGADWRLEVRQGDFMYSNLSAHMVTERGLQVDWLITLDTVFEYDLAKLDPEGSTVLLSFRKPGGSWRHAYTLDLDTLILLGHGGRRDVEPFVHPSKPLRPSGHRPAHGPEGGTAAQV